MFSILLPDNCSSVKLGNPLSISIFSISFEFNLKTVKFVFPFKKSRLLILEFPKSNTSN